MKPLLSLSIALCCALALASRPSVRKELESVLKSITEAVQHRDEKVFGSYLAEDFTSTDQSGKIHTRAEVIRDWTGMMQAMSDFKWERHIKSLKSDGNAWLTVTESHLSAKVPGRDGKPHSFTFDATSQDRWEKVKGRWRDHAAKVLKSVAKLDGKPTPMR